MKDRAAIILAAGQGTRMKSAMPKVLHKVAGRPMIDWSIALARRTDCEKIIVVCGPDQKQLQDHVRSVLGEDAVAIQETPLGTGHAVLSAKAAMSGFRGDVVVLYGDCPLLPATPILDLFGLLEQGAGVGVLGFHAANPGAYGRLITNKASELEAIVEAKDASQEELEITLCNSGVLAARSDRLFRLLEQVTNDNAKGEYYLTDLVGLTRADGAIAKAITCNEEDTLGVNSRVELAVAEQTFQQRRRDEALIGGVTMTAPSTVFFAYDTIIENDVIIEPNVVFGPGVHVSSGTIIKAFSHIEGARIGANCDVGPYARLRPGAVLDEQVKVGNFVEIKKTHLGAGAKANHLSYLGDGHVGAGTNIGAGVIFCNYDGFMKYQTKIGDNAFIGSNSSLVAPLTVGAGAIVGSGSVITKDVPKDALVVARGRQVERDEWAVSFREKKLAEKTADKEKKV